MFVRKTEVVGFSSGVMRFSLLELLLVLETLMILSSRITNVPVVRVCAVFSLQKLGKTLADSFIAVLFLRYVYHY